MKPQLWWCERCGTLGATMFEDHADVMTVIYQMGDQHAGATPECPVSAMGLKSLCIENIHEPFVLKLVK